MCPKRKSYMLINHENVEESVLKMSGINSQWQKIFYNSLVRNPNETLKRLRIIYSKDHNVIIRDGRRCKKTTDIYSQPLIVDVDVETNNRIKVKTAEVVINDSSRLGYD